MIYQLIHSLHHKKLEDLLFSITFGVLSALFSLIQLPIINYENAYSDLREIPLLMGVFHLRNPLYIIIMSLLAPILFRVNGNPYFATFLFHIIPLFAIWFFYQWLSKRSYSGWKLGLIWFIATIFYYILLVFPNLIFVYQFFNLHYGQSFFTSFSNIFKSTKFEIVATGIATAMYLIQFEIRKALELVNKNLERIVETRTQELSSANDKLQNLNKELLSTNEEVQSLNENLEERVRERTERIKQSEEELEKMNRSLAKTTHDLDEFIYTASHDLKVPMTNIEGIIHLLNSEKNYNKETREIFDMMMISVSQFKDTVNNLTEISKVQHLYEDDIEELDVQEIVKQAMSYLNNEIRVSGAIVVTNFSKVPYIVFSKKNFLRIVENLIDNAIKFRSPDRTLHITLSTDEKDGFDILAIADNGLGIKGSYHDKIFSMFKKAHVNTEGKGIGLYIIKRILEKEGGRIEVESEEGKGSIFRLFIRK